MSCGARPFENNEKERLIAKLEGTYRLRDRAMVQLGMYSGLRVSSILSLRVGDVWDGSRFRPRLRIARRNLKGKKEGLDLPFHMVARFALGRWLVHLRQRGVELDPAMPVFLSREGSGKALFRVGGRRRLFRLRHTRLDCRREFRRIRGGRPLRENSTRSAGTIFCWFPRRSTTDSLRRVSTTLRGSSMNALMRRFCHYDVTFLEFCCLGF